MFQEKNPNCWTFKTSVWLSDVRSKPNFVLGSPYQTMIIRTYQYLIVLR